MTMPTDSSLPTLGNTTDDPLRPISHFFDQIKVGRQGWVAWVHSGLLRTVRINRRFLTRQSWVDELIANGLDESADGVLDNTAGAA